MAQTRGEAVAHYYDKPESAPTGVEGLGRIHVCYGRGAGKTTKAVGLAVRAAGAGLRVTFIQFMKSGNSSEVNILKTIANLHYRCPGRHSFILDSGPEAAHFEHARQALLWAREAVDAGEQVLVCDEILNTLLFGLLKVDQLKDLINRCRDRVELVMTGSDAPPEIIDAADYVTELLQTKHPYYSGTKARRGIEF